VIHDRSPKGDLFAGFQKAVLNKIDPRKFLDEMLPGYVEAFRVAETGRDETGLGAPQGVLDSINQLRALEHKTWRAPAIQFIVERGFADPRAAEFFASLERTSYISQVMVQEREARNKKLARITDAIRNDRVLFSKTGPFMVTRDEARKLRDRLTTRFGTYGQRRAIALRLNAAIEGGRTIPPESDATVEHVLPRNPPEDSHWMITWPDPVKRREQCDTIGNFVLLTNKVNQLADRLDYRAKKEIYFNGGGGQEFALTRDLMEQDAWTSDVVRRRTEKLADIMMAAWGLSL
jgi:hypothetical protein